MTFKETPWPSIIDQLPVGLFILDRTKVIREWNLWLERRTQVEPADAIGRRLAEVFEGFEDPPFEKAFAAVLATGAPEMLSRALDHYLIPIAVRARRGPRGILMEQRVELSRVTSRAGEQAVMVVISDVTEAVRRVEALFAMLRSIRRRSNTDALTGLYNRGFMSDWMDQAIKFSVRNRTALSVVMLDIDLFKRINDTHGHVVGDLVLRDLALVLRAQVRDSDVVVRYGGEEFAILMPSCGLESAIPRARDVVNGIRGESLGSLVVGAVTCSAGVSAFDPSHPCTVHDLVRQADKHLYAAKHAGGNIALPETASAA
jgi:diguanylate cyclase (GGDEF)-like protein